MKLGRACACALLALGTALGGCRGGDAKAPHADYGGAAQPRVSTAKDRRSVAVTVYNASFGVVREVREVGLGRGRIALEFGDVAEQIQPETVHIRSLTDVSALSVLEQNYRYDLLSPAKLLEKYVGKRVRVHRWTQRLGKEEVVDAEVLSAVPAPVFRIGGEVTYGFPGRISFPEVPANLIAKPTLVWLLGSDQPRQEIEVTYVTRGMSWRSDYVLTIDDEDALGDLVGWVTLQNGSGTTFEDASLKLVAGDVQRVVEMQPEEVERFAKKADDAEKDGNGFKEEGLFEYHLYTLQRRTSLRDKEQKQVSLFEANGIALHKHLVFDGSEGYFRSELGEVESDKKVGVFLEIKNDAASHLGMPLPKGIVRVYKADKSGAKQFIGEDSIDHTPRDEKLRVKMGDAFDVVGDRKQSSFGALGDCAAESEWEIALRNHKDTAEHVLVVEPAGGDWEILRSSHAATRKDAHTFTFDAVVPARGATKVTYRVRVRWC